MINLSFTLKKMYCRDKIGNNYFQNFHFGRYIVVYTVGNIVLRPRPNGSRYMPHKAACHLTKCDVVNDVKLFPAGISQDILSQIFDVI